jgi:hypothetical protein
MEFLGDFFYGAWYWYTLIKKLKKIEWNSIFKMCFLHFLKQWMNNNIFLLGKKSLPYQRGGDFINGHCIVFSISFCSVMFHELQTWSPMAIEKL